MSDPQKALATQLANIEAKTGMTIAALKALVRASGLEKHSAIRDMLKEKFGLGFGDANTLAHAARQESEPAVAEPGGLYSGAKSALRPIHDKLMAAIEPWGGFELAPKKTYVSLRRKKQFAMIGPATNTRVEVGLNLSGVMPSARLEAMPPKSMCSFRVKVTNEAEVDAELIAWIRQAYEQAG